MGRVTFLYNIVLYIKKKKNYILKYGRVDASGTDKIFPRRDKY